MFGRKARTIKKLKEELNKYKTSPIQSVMEYQRAVIIPITATIVYERGYDEYVKDDLAHMMAKEIKNNMDFSEEIIDSNNSKYIAKIEIVKK